jgi:hypothetical protein
MPGLTEENHKEHQSKDTRFEPGISGIRKNSADHWDAALLCRQNTEVYFINIHEQNSVVFVSSVYLSAIISLLTASLYRTHHELSHFPVLCRNLQRALKG